MPLRSASVVMPTVPVKHFAVVMGQLHRMWAAWLWGLMPRQIMNVQLLSEDSIKVSTPGTLLWQKVPVQRLTALPLALVPALQRMVLGGWPLAPAGMSLARALCYMAQPMVARQ
ncbi:hypothetical protein ACG11_08560 [Salmonella enterica subsp. enterica serovar Enteritidis]|nr:hypothetical protein ACG11_08560 [Salmonella enterica subsp. enterica serovar Enteritidis]